MTTSRKTKSAKIMFTARMLSLMINTVEELEREKNEEAPISVFSLILMRH